MDDPVRLQNAIARAHDLGALALLDVAETIVDSLELLQPLPPQIRFSIANWPDRWLPVLRRRVAEGFSPRSHAAARVLDDMGEAVDIPLLRAYDRTYLRGTRAAGLGRRLIQETSPTVYIHDLGRGSLVVGTHSTTFGAMRRRAAGLLCYLASRPSRSAPREQIMEDLWSDLAPASAANSLNQTLYFLRRDSIRTSTRTLRTSTSATPVTWCGWIDPRLPSTQFGLALAQRQRFVSRSKSQLCASSA